MSSTGSSAPVGRFGSAIPSDRRAVVVKAVDDRAAEVLSLYSGMNASLGRICSGYDDAQLATIADFLARTGAAGRSATEELATDD